MEELIKTFHIDAKLIIAQLVNFLIVLFVLKKFAYEPLLKLMDERTGKIEKGIKDAEDAHKKLTEIADKEKQVLVEARKQAQEILAKADEASVKSREEAVVNAKKEAEKIISEAGKKMDADRNQMMSEIKAEMAGLIVSATEKLISEKMDTAKDKEIIQNMIK